MPQNRNSRAYRDSVQASPASFWSVIPAGGAGTRLWPLSRAARPKFLLPLIGERSLLQETAGRLSPLAPVEQTIVVCGAAHAAAIARQLPELPESNLVTEPMSKGSGPAIALATAIVGSFASDHYIEDQDAFIRAARTAIAAADTNFLVTIGLTPTHPETGYGYIARTDDVLARLETGTAFRAASFIEKPDLARAIQCGSVVQIGTTNFVSRSGTDRLIALVGVDNIVVVDTPDALLVVDRCRSQDVRQIVRILQIAEQSRLL